jgi:hypothetical protein
MHLRRCSFRIIRAIQSQGTHAAAHSTNINITILFNGFCNTNGHVEWGRKINRDIKLHSLVLSNRKHLNQLWFVVGKAGFERPNKWILSWTYYSKVVWFNETTQDCSETICFQTKNEAKVSKGLTPVPTRRGEAGTNYRGPAVPKGVRGRAMFLSYRLPWVSSPVPTRRGEAGTNCRGPVVRKDVRGPTMFLSFSVVPLFVDCLNEPFKTKPTSLCKWQSGFQVQCKDF